jgi:hypothetical protein
MLNMAPGGDAVVQPFLATLWRCQNCSSLVSIYSPNLVDEAFCPICLGMPMELCANMDSFANLQVASA